MTVGRVGGMTRVASDGARSFTPDRMPGCETAAEAFMAKVRSGLSGYPYPRVFFFRPFSRAAVVPCSHLRVLCGERSR